MSVRPFTAACSFGNNSDAARHCCEFSGTVHMLKNVNYGSVGHGLIHTVFARASIFGRPSLVQGVVKVVRVLSLIHLAPTCNGAEMLATLGKGMRVSQLLATLLAASATSEVEHLLDVPRDMPVRCRFRAEWDFSRCCDASRPELLDSTCFRLQTPEGRDYAIQHCCDDRQGLRDHSRVVQAVVGMAGCLFGCRCHEKASFDCGCEKIFLQDMERIASDLRIAHRNRFWRAAGRWSVGNRSAHWNNRSANAIVLDCSENKRSGLRMLEHVLLSVLSGAQVLQGTESFNLLSHALEQHHLISGSESQTRLRAARRKLHLDRLRNRFKPEVWEPVHIAMVASIGEPVNGRRALATIRSALYHAKEKPLHFHLFVDQAGHEDMQSVLREWLEPELHRRIAKISWYGPAHFPRIWKILHARVPAECMAGYKWWKDEYGAPGWMRLFPEEVFKKAPDHLIWTDAGDYLFFSDPAKLLQEHLRVVGSSKAVATYAGGILGRC